MPSTSASENQAVLSLLPAGRAEWRLVAIVLLASLGLFAVAAPFAKVALAQVPAFLPFYQSAICVNDAITAVLLFGQARAARSRALLVLGSGYVFTALITLAHLLTYPAVFAPTGLLGAGSQSTAWLYMFWHAGFPLVVAAYALLPRDPPASHRISASSIVGGVLLAAIAALLLTLAATRGHDFLPVVMADNRYTDAYPYVVASVWILPAIATAMLWRRRPHTVLDAWLLVVMCVWMFDIALSAVLNGGRYDLGFYVGRVYGLLAASFVLMVLLFEHSVLHARLIAARASERRKAGELMRATAQMAAQREHESAQKLLDAVVHQMPGGLVIVDEAGEVIFSNERAEHILGFSMSDPGKRRLALATDLNGRPLAKAEYPLARALNGETLADYELCVTRPDGRAQVLSASAAPVHDIDGRMVGAVSAFSDITQRKEAERERLDLLDREQRARAEAEVANRSKDEFLAMLGHELRNPLAPIRTALQLMRLRGDTALMHERVIIERQVEHLVRLVDDLLDVSRITSGKIELKRRLCDVADIVAHAIEMASPLIEQRQHRLQISVERGLTIDCDPTRFAQVVSNLLINAAKYTQPRGQVAVAAALDNGEVEIRVEDSGQGLSEELLARIFEPFVQGKQSIERSEGGLGLGLAIANSIARMHGGTIAARSGGTGQGSEFIVRVPGAIAPERQASLHGAIAPGLSPSASAVRVLLVDDNVDAAAMLDLGLRAFGIEPHVAHDGPQALQKAGQQAFDVVLLDLGLPVMDGYQVAARLRAMPNTADATMVAITGYGETSDIEKTRAQGFAAHLVKPVDIADLLAVIRGARPDLSA